MSANSPRAEKNAKERAEMTHHNNMDAAFRSLNDAAAEAGGRPR